MVGFRESTVHTAGQAQTERTQSGFSECDILTQKLVKEKSKIITDNSRRVQNEILSY